MRLLLLAAACLLVGASATEQMTLESGFKPKKGIKKTVAPEPAKENGYTVMPIIVENRKGGEVAEDKGESLAPFTAPFIAKNEGLLDDIIKQKEEAIHELNKKLEDTIKHKVQLKLTEDLFKGIMGLKKAREAAKAADEKIAKIKKRIEAHGAKAAEIAENVKRAEAERKREREERNKELANLQKDLAEVQGKLHATVEKRQRFKASVDKWRQFVAVLRDAYERYSVPSAAAKDAKAAAPKPAAAPAEPEFIPEPPSAAEVLGRSGVQFNPQSIAGLRGAALKKQVHEAEAIVAKEITVAAAASANDKKDADKVPARVKSDSEGSSGNFESQAAKQRFAGVDIDVDSEAAELDAELKNAETESNLDEAISEATASITAEED